MNDDGVSVSLYDNAEFSRVREGEREREWGGGGLQIPVHLSFRLEKHDMDR